MTVPAEQAQDDPAVLIVGAGPVGLVLACELARRGVGIRLVDTLPVATTESRAILVHARSLEMLERVGVVDDIIASGVTTHAMQMHDAGRTLAHIALDGVDSPYPFSVTTAQTETERILTERLSELGVTIDRGVELVGFDQDGTGVRARLRHADGSSEAARSSWIVGTDGAHSTVRNGMGLRLEGSFAGECFLMGDVDADHDLDPATMHSYSAPGDGPLLVFPMVGRRLRMIAQITGDRDPTDLTVERLQRVADARAGGITVRSSRWITTFEIHHAQAPRYRVGRALLAGDAAHVHSPAGGQGMNTGMQDAFNLGWKLALVAGGSDERLLESYQEERHPVAAKVIVSTTTMTLLATLDSHVARTLRNNAVHLATRIAPVAHVLAEQTEETGLAYRGSSIVAGRGTHRGVHPGDIAPDVEGTGLHATLAAGSGHTALHIGDGTAAAPVPVAGVRNVLDAALDDPDRRVAHRYGLDRGGVVLVRPDGYVGFVGEPGDVAGVDAYLGQFR